MTIHRKKKISQKRLTSNFRYILYLKFDVNVLRSALFPMDCHTTFIYFCVTLTFILEFWCQRRLEKFIFPNGTSHLFLVNFTQVEYVLRWILFLRLWRSIGKAVLFKTFDVKVQVQNVDVTYFNALDMSSPNRFSCKLSFMN